jgi:hypothetical protein
LSTRSGDRRRRPAAAAVALLGLVLLGLDVAPRLVPDRGLVIAWRFFGVDAGHGIAAWLPDAQPMAAFAGGLAQRWIVWLAVVLVASTVLGIATATVVAQRLSRRASLAVRVACIAAWAVALDPEVAWFVATRDGQSAARYLDVGDLARALGLGALWIAFVLWRGRTADPGADRAAPTPTHVHARDAVESTSSAGAPRPSWSLLGAMLAAAIVPSLVSSCALGRWPLVNDEHSYLAQARLLAHGEVFRNLGGIADFFPSPQSVIENGRWFVFYLPGHAAALVPGTRLGWPELVPRLFAMFSVALTWSLAARLGVARPTWAAWCLALSPAFLGVESLYLSHATSLPCTLLFVWGALNALDASPETSTRRALGFAALAGFAFAAAAITRPVTALAIAVPIAILLVRERPRNLVPLVAAAACATLPWVLWLANVDRVLTGSALKTAYGVYARYENAVYGAVDLGTASSAAAFNLSRMSVWLCGVAPGLLLPVIGIAFAPRGPRTWLLAALPVSLFAFYTLHPFHGIPWVGPVYLSEGLPALAILSAQGMFVIEQAFGRRLRNAAIAISIAGSALLLASHFRLAREEVELRRRPYDAAREHDLARGIVFVRMDTLRARRLYPMRPPEPDEPLVFARDLGPRDAELVHALGDPPAWIYDPETDEMRPR